MAKVGPFDIELVPKSSWGKSLASLARTPGSGFRAGWTKIRSREIARAGRKCEYCGATDKGLLCHEEWEYDRNSLTQRLVGFRISCADCNLILHSGRTSVLGKEKEALDHFVRVTGLPASALNTAVLEAMREWRSRSRFTWKIDVSAEPIARDFSERLNALQARYY